MYSFGNTILHRALVSFTALIVSGIDSSICASRCNVARERKLFVDDNAEIISRIVVIVSYFKALKSNLVYSSPNFLPRYAPNITHMCKRFPVTFPKLIVQIKAVSTLRECSVPTYRITAT